MKPHPSRRPSAFTLMEVLVVLAIILVLAAILFPVINAVKTKSNMAVAVTNLRNLSSAAANYAGQKDGTYPKEGPSAVEWQTALEEDDAWWNVLPRLLGGKGVADYAKDNGQDFYSKQNILWLPGAEYPTDGSEMARPLFAIAMNTKLQRRDSEGKKPSLRINTVTHPSRTVLFFESGIKGEKKASPTQPKYKGEPKGGARDFVARYNGVGVIAFFDGHTEVVKGSDMVNDVGRYPFPNPDPIWCRTPEEDPNLAPDDQ